jgi:replication-associated recombination protein RarA
LDDLGSDVMLILTTNNFMKIHPSLRSRCKVVEMPALTAQDVLPRAQWILQQEGLILERDQLLTYLKPQQVSGDLRKYFGELDKLLYLHTQGLPMPPWNPAATRQAMRVV